MATNPSSPKNTERSTIVFADGSQRVFDHLDVKVADGAVIFLDVFENCLVVSLRNVQSIETRKLPDEEAIKALWHTLREEYPEIFREQKL